jgi:hypothetical protein
MAITLCSTHGVGPCAGACGHLAAAVEERVPLSISYVDVGEPLLSYAWFCDACARAWERLRGEEREPLLESCTFVCLPCFDEWRAIVYNERDR